MTEAEEMRKYAEAHGCLELRIPKMTDEELKRLRDCIDSEQAIRIEPDLPVRPLPCVRDEHGEIKKQTIKALLIKIDEELNELKEEIYGYLGHLCYSSDISAEELIKEFDAPCSIAEEAADTITAITTMLEALGIDAEMRDEAQRRVNKKNMERGRL
jgi:NTP pyrophosphatase (non-canonical NTP hydrolase)